MHVFYSVSHSGEISIFNVQMYCTDWKTWCHTIPTDDMGRYHRGQSRTDPAIPGWLATLV